MLADFKKNIADQVAKTQADMSNLLFTYGYKKQYVCSFNIVDNSIVPTTMQGISKITRVSGASIIIYTCTLPTPLPYAFTPFAQFTANKATASTLDNDFSVLVAKYIDNSTFSVAIERSSSGNDVTIAVTLVQT